MHARNLPWRENTDPYRIWISEIMLQQTRVDTVIDYFHRFMQTFPTIKDLANADDEKLLKVWEGLGYYSRARNLKVAANQVMDDYGGKFPQTPAEIRKLKGIGPYTTGAISSIAFRLPEPASRSAAVRHHRLLQRVERGSLPPARQSIRIRNARRSGRGRRERRAAREAWQRTSRPDTVSIPARAPVSSIRSHVSSRAFCHTEPNC